MLIRWLISALAIFIAAYITPGVSTTFIGALVVAVVLGLLNTFIKPILVILTLPLTILTMGLFYFVLNALMVMLAAGVVKGFEVSGFLYALLFALVLSVVQMIIKDK